jgi:acetyl-CoA carboxylase, biotin carboxylase subunit
LRLRARIAAGDRLMLKKVLIANRGVVAMRIARTLRRLGVPYAVVYSEADAKLPYVREATEAMLIGEARPQLSYLRHGALLEAAHRAGCDAIHPGYGFLSESADFARKVVDAGFAFIGPEPRHIAALGDKARARAVMVEAGFPALPASAPLSDEGDAEALANAIGYPLLIKASAGGGGVGMQRVNRPDQLADALAKARSFAERFFGDRTVFLERWLTEARHVEFQIVADGMGDALSLHQRDCSVQRRHQKVIEEAPAPFIDEDAARDLGERLAAFFGRFGYRSLATVEMLMDRDGRFYFLEVNTRLQVEHGVTELITGLDLVEIQLRLASGERLTTILPAAPEPNGHAIEARIYAEDPVRFLPSPGPLRVFRPPSARPGLSMDVGYAEDDVVTPFYDPMLALVIAHGRDRSSAIARLDGALADFTIEGVKTNIPFLRNMLASEVFEQGGHHTTFAETFASHTKMSSSSVVAT